MYEAIVLYDGYSNVDSNESKMMTANCTCTLVKGLANNIIVDTMTPWDSEKILNGNFFYLPTIVNKSKIITREPFQNRFVFELRCDVLIDDQNLPIFAYGVKKDLVGVIALKENNVAANDINYVISTHGHSDHVGNNNLFLKAKHIVGFSISHKDCYFLYDFDKGKEYIIDEYVKVIPTPGHTLTDVTVIVSSNDGIIALAGDLFEKYEDIENPQLWIEAGSEDPAQQRKNRSKVANMADWIIPGHGPKFQVNESIRQELRKQAIRDVKP